MVSELLEEAGIDRERLQRIRRQVLEGIIFLCQWQLERMERGREAPAEGPRGLTRTAILDVYCPGRVPQVQLLDNHFAVARGYEPGEPRTDIKLDIVEKLVNEMSRRGT
jgi:hypothetical protein